MADETLHSPVEEPFEQEAPGLGDHGTLVLNLDGYEGPLDVLLALARDQKVDLKQISILQLAEQYLAFIQELRKVRLEIAADYLVMAAWLAYLKSRLLLPETEKEEEGLSGAEMAERLAFQLRRLEAMRGCGQRLMGRHQFRVDFFPRGRPEGVRVLRRSVFELSLIELLKGYADFRVSRGSGEALRLRRTQIFSVEMALQRLSEMLGRVPEWSVLQTFLPPGLLDPFSQRSAMASTLIASLELAKQGRLTLRQGQSFGPIYLRRLDKGSTESS
ncbi:MAG: segregation/condensation protein A [Alphaproteobacteria bacterium]|nr:segregation/condensation protein A [Alphaproteobacteria bacterium]